MVIFMYLFILILSVISCFVGFVLEVAEGNICHIQNGRLPNAGVAIFPNIPVVPLIYVLVVWLLNHLYQDLGFIVVATFSRTNNEKVFQMKTSTDRLPEYKKYGVLHFTLDGKKLSLNVYQNMELTKKAGYEEYLFLPFSDKTNGHESYIGGRYIDMRIQEGSSWMIDFNKAYNPYCAYNYKYSCPIVPLDNDLPIEIKAGVKKFHD